MSYDPCLVIYACFIGDGYAEVERPTDGTGPEEGASYWYTPRNAEVGCPSCGQEGTFSYTGADGKERERPCRTCEGSGLVTGEPFTVTRYTFATEAAALACYARVEDAGDGYERAGVLALASNDADGQHARPEGATSVDVVTWEPEHELDAGGPPPACETCGGDGWIYEGGDATTPAERCDCPECDGAGFES